VDFAGLKNKNDEEVIAELVQIVGVGQWTAEMLLMFSLQRPDIFSVGDLGLRSAISKLYGIDRENRAAILELSQQWSPYRTLASRYLWASLENTPKINEAG
jgi:DNA-3-methyladenine glycosylase II